MIGCLAAQKVNIGKKRPKHSKFMIEFSQKNFYIPEGIFLLQEASDLYGRDLVMSWCRNPDIQISKMMIMKAKKLSLEEHSHWIGKTRRAIGFWHRDNAI